MTIWDELDEIKEIVSKANQILPDHKNTCPTQAYWQSKDAVGDVGGDPNSYWHKSYQRFGLKRFLCKIFR